MLFFSMSSFARHASITNCIWINLPDFRFGHTSVKLFRTYLFYASRHKKSTATYLIKIQN